MIVTDRDLWHAYRAARTNYDDLARRAGQILGWFGCRSTPPAVLVDDLLAPVRAAWLEAEALYREYLEVAS